MNYDAKYQRIVSNDNAHLIFFYEGRKVANQEKNCIYVKTRTNLFIDSKQILFYSRH